MVYTIQNDLLSVAVETKGAELQSIIHKDFRLEYLWSGDPKYWAKKSPVLFPVVGALKDNSYQYKGTTYQLNRHGFARDREFGLAEQTDNSLTFSLNSDPDTLSIYPFDFNFLIRYALDNNRLSVSYIIRNTGKENMLFSVGGHPAFKVPLAEGTVFEDYFLEFSHFEHAERYPLSGDGLIESRPVPVFDHTDKLPLKKELFYEDALVFKNLVSKSIFILSDKTSHGLKMNFHDFPYLGIWSARGANFVCLEPWCGIADTVGTSGKLEEKEGVNTLSPETVFSRTWHVELF